MTRPRSTVTKLLQISWPLLCACCRFFDNAQSSCPLSNRKIQASLHAAAGPPLQVETCQCIPDQCAPKSLLHLWRASPQKTAFYGAYRHSTLMLYQPNLLLVTFFRAELIYTTSTPLRCRLPTYARTPALSLAASPLPTQGKCRPSMWGIQDVSKVRPTCTLNNTRTQNFR